MIYKKDNEYYKIYFVGYSLTEYGINAGDKTFIIKYVKNKFIDVVPEIYLKLMDIN